MQALKEEVASIARRLGGVETHGQGARGMHEGTVCVANYFLGRGKKGPPRSELDFSPVKQSHTYNIYTHTHI